MRPLDGVRVLDLSWLGPGCVTTWLLADMGAEVIKVEPPDGSDNIRHFGPAVGGTTVAHLSIDREKHSFAVDLRDDRGRDAFRAVARQADAIVEGFRPGVADRLGIGYDQLVVDNPRLVYCTVTGFGAGGPLERVAGHDLNYVAQTGMLSLPSDTALPPLQAADYLGATSAAFAVVAGVLQAHRTGQGMQVESSLFDGAMFALMQPASQCLALGADLAGGQHMLAGGLAAYALYTCADGRQLSVAPLERKFWRRFCALSGLDDEVDTDHHDPDVQDRLRARITAALAGRTRAEWLTIFEEEDVCVAPVLTVGEAIQQPHVRDRGGLVTVLHPVLGEVQVPAGPVRIHGRQPDGPVLVPSLGSVTASLLAQAGLEEDRISALVEAGIIHVA